jgi:protein-disulfide isomerase
MKRTRLLAILAGGLVLAGALVGISLATRGGHDDTLTSRPAAADGGVATLLRGIPQRGVVLGSPRAPVTLVEFADLQCPYCGEWARVAFPDVVRHYVRSGQVRVVFRGLAFVGPDSVPALQSTLAAGKQNRLWHVLEGLYRNQGAENTGWVSDDLMRRIGSTVPGLDVDRMLRDRDSSGVDAAMLAARNDAVRMGVNSTPSFAVGYTGKALRVVQVSSLDAQGIAPAIDALLER